MKYTPSGDGIERATVWVECRLTREQMAELRQYAREQHAGASINTMLARWLDCAIDGNLNDLGGDDVGGTHSGDN